MALRVIAILLAAVVVVGIAAPTALASRNVASLVDDGTPEPQPAVVAWPVAFDPPRGEPSLVVVPPADSRGRRHQVQVFRPPRGIAPR